MRALTLPEAIEFTILGAELERAFRAIDALPSSMQKKGEPRYDRWRALALRFNEMRKD